MTRHDVTRQAPARVAIRKPADERWAELLRVSARRFARDGYAATSLQNIADDLGLLKGSLYYYIDTKEDLLYEVIKSVYQVGVETIQAGIAAPGTAVQRLRMVIRNHVTYLIESIDATTVYLLESGSLNAEHREELDDFDYVGAVRSLIVEGQREGTLRPDIDPTLASLAALGAANWVHRWYRSGPFSPDEVGRHFADMTVRGMLPDGVRLE